MGALPRCPAGAGPGPYEEGLHVRMSATATGTVTVSDADPSFDAVAITSLAFATDEVLDDPDRESVRQLLVLIAWRMATFALAEGGPALPLASVEATPEFEPYGLTAGTVLGTIAPSLATLDGGLLAEGAFGEIVAPDM